MESNNKRSLGLAAEDMAAAFLQNLGYVIIKRNFQFGKVGEIDIICSDAETLVFVEVKGRRSSNYGSPESSITPRKKQQIRRVAKAYLHIKGILDVECRFDVVAVDEAVFPTEIRHYINAFW